ncbi:MAG: ubiquinol-cytochrome c reductase iron-sulfur subunit [Acidobacteriota bacterium]
MQEGLRSEGEGTARRRTALRWLIRGFLSLWGLGGAFLGLSFLRAPSAERRPSERLVRCGPVSTLPVGGARFVRHGTRPLFVLRVSESEVLALSAICTHLRCVLRWDRDSQTLVCPCHSGAFDRGGNVLSGPTKRPLPRYEAEVRADEIVVRT